MAVGGLRTLLRTYEESGLLIGMEFGRFIGEDALALAVSDAVLVGSTVICVPFVKVRRDCYSIFPVSMC